MNIKITLVHPLWSIMQPCSKIFAIVTQMFRKTSNMEKGHDILTEKKTGHTLEGK